MLKKIIELQLLHTLECNADNIVIQEYIDEISHIKKISLG